VGGRSKLYRTARQAVERGWVYAYRDRRTRKREIRRLWIVRINAAAHITAMNYSQLIDGLHKAEVTVDRKILAHLAWHEPETFARLCAVARGEAAPASVKATVETKVAADEPAGE